MREAILSITDEAALGLQTDLAPFEAAGLLDVQALSCEGDRGVVRVRTEEAVDTGSVAESAAIEWLEPAATEGSDHAYLLEFDVGGDPQRVAACTEGIVRCEPVEVSGSGIRLRLAGTQDAIAETLEALEGAGATVGLETLRDYRAREGPLDALTDRQREVLSVAHGMGYFDVPREATTDDVAAAVELDDSTVTEHLQRAERNLLSEVMAEAV